MPDISVIIPTFNRPRHLAACLDALAGQSLARDRFEIIVVDDGGRTDTRGVVDRCPPRLQVQLVRQDNAGPAKARNAGVEKASGRFIALTDDDCEPDESWLHQLLAALEKDPDALVGGDTQNCLEDNIWSQASQVLVDYLYSYFESEKPELFFFTTNNLALARERFLQVGGFDESFPMASAEDREFCDRWIFRGGRMVHVQTALVYHSHLLTPPAFIELHYRYGMGARSFWSRRVERGQAANRIFKQGFYGRLLRHPWKAGCERPLATSLLLAVSQLANATGYAMAKFSRTG